MDGLLHQALASPESIRSVNFFNGRMLTAEDMNREKSANREGRKQLGRAIGSGVAYGLEVAASPRSTPAQPLLVVQPGLAVNSRGRTVELHQAATLALARPPESRTGGQSAFEDCLPPQGGVYIVDDGVYLLTVGPAEMDEGRAPTSGLGGNVACNARYKVEAVTFRLTSLSDLLQDELADPARLRNRLAHRCFGTGDARRTASRRRPLDVDQLTYGLLSDLGGGLSSCETPLAVLHWTRSGLQFVDMWPVRRRISAPSASMAWTGTVGDRIAGEDEALFLQFQEHLAALHGLAALRAGERFRYLPPAAFLPIQAPGSPQGFDFRAFFQGLPVREPAYISEARAEALIRLSLDYPPIDLRSGELIWLYQVVEHTRDLAAGVGGLGQQYLIFASGHIPYQSEARLDVARYDFSQYGLAVAGGRP